MDIVTFRPEAVAWWRLLEGVGARLGRVHRCTAADHPPWRNAGAQEQHHTATLVLCLGGTSRVLHARGRLDLLANDAVLIEAGAWHGHAPMRAGALAFGQGVMAGRSDWILHDHRLQIISSVPEQPSWRGLESAVAEPDEVRRREMLRRHLAGLVLEHSVPISSAHPAYAPMELALWNHLHRPDAVTAMVRASGLSRAQAYRVFTACAGVGPAAAVRRERIALVKRLLAERIPAAAAAARCGFSSIRQMRRQLARSGGGDGDGD